MSLREGRYFLRWETLPLNRDQRRQPPFPPPSMLRVYQRPTPDGEDPTEAKDLHPPRLDSRDEGSAAESGT